MPRRALAVACALFATQSVADITCRMNDPECDGACAETTVQFSIDANQFVAPQDPADPPRRQVTTVTIGERRFAAQAIMMDGGIVGYFEDTPSNGSSLMIVQADGAARLVIRPADKILTGTCASTD